MKTCPSSSTPARACSGRRCGRWKLLLIAAAALLGIASLTGCSEDVAGPEEVNGTYLLGRVEDKAMPAQFVDRAGSVMTFSEGELTLHPDGSCTFVLKGKLNTLLFEHHKVGTYVLDGSRVSFSIPDDPSRLTTGRLDEDRVVLDYHIAGITWTMTLNR